MITFRVETSLGIVVTTWKGKVSNADLISAYTKLFEDPAFQPGFHELLDVSEADMVEVSGEGLRKLELFIESQTPDSVGEFKTAVVAPEDLSFGLARMYGFYSDDSSEAVRVFRDSEKALDWLGAPRELLS